MLVETTFSTDGRSLNYMTCPQHGAPLMLLHGVTRRWQTFMPLLPSLAQRWHVHALDFRGHGKSDRAGNRYLVADYVRDAVGLLQTQICDRAVIYGHSLGSMVAAAVAAQVPHLVRAVIMEDPPFDTMGVRITQTVLHSFFVGLQSLSGSNRSVQDVARDLAEIQLWDPVHERSIRLGDVRDPTSLRFTAACLAQLDPQVLSSIVAGNWLDGFDSEAVLAAVRCPVLLLQADVAAGGMLDECEADRAERLLADCVRVRFPGVGHLIHWSDADATLRHVLSFLESLDSPGGTQP